MSSVLEPFPSPLHSVSPPQPLLRSNDLASPGTACTSQRLRAGDDRVLGIVPIRERGAFPSFPCTPDPCFFAPRRALTDLPLQALGQDTFSNRLLNVQHISVSGLLLILMPVGASGAVLRSTSSCPRRPGHIRVRQICLLLLVFSTYLAINIPLFNRHLAVQAGRSRPSIEQPKSFPPAPRSFFSFCIPPAGPSRPFPSSALPECGADMDIAFASCSRTLFFPPARSSFLARPESESESGCTSRIQAFQDKPLQLLSSPRLFTHARTGTSLCFAHISTATGALPPPPSSWPLALPPSSSPSPSSPLVVFPLAAIEDGVFLSLRS
ncbi:hypothetical protein B0H13DRAFT_2339665 [Mycena leptocephala]|nr:hypothetical protein B0H13DRAFT_2339665 [Mycena leptocephala]